MKEEFCHCDLWSAETFPVALEAQESTMLSLLVQGIKIHTWLARRAFEGFDDLPPDEKKRKYKLAKTTVHGMNYGASAKKIQEVTGESLPLCQYLYGVYHATFPGVKRRQHQIEQQVRQTRTLTSLLGRKRVFFGPLTSDLFRTAYGYSPQSTVGEITEIAFTRLYFWSKTSDLFLMPVMNTHDGIVLRKALGHREEVIERIRRAFYVPLRYGKLHCVIPVEVGFGPTFDDVGDKITIRYEKGGETHGTS